MTAVDLCVFLTSYTLVVGFAAVAELLRSQRAWALVSVAAALGAITATTVVGFYLKPGENYFGILWFLASERDFSAVVSIGLGVAAGLVWVTRLIDGSRLDAADVRWRTIKYGAVQIVLAASIIGVVLCCEAFVWKEIRGMQRDPMVRMHVPGFVIEKVADLSFPPIRVAVDNDKAYVSYDYFQEAGVIGGGIIELLNDDVTGKFQQRIVADSPLLMRGYGLVARDGELFVSRSGISASAIQGKIEYAETGTVTQLRDVDGDGYFEFANDVVTGLPGIRGPETMHQNNGICFDAEGSLFVAIASSANRALDDHPWGGTVLKVSPDFTESEIFARGFRNPFGIMVGPDDEIFVTDNDTDENPGDELNHVVRGAHYGHPFVIPDEHSVETEGFRDPIMVGEHEWNFLGMAYGDSPALPRACRDCIYVADFMQHAIWRMKLEKSGDTYRVEKVDKFATISSPVDIAMTSTGEFFVVSRHTKNVYRIRPSDTGSGGNDG